MPFIDPVTEPLNCVCGFTKCPVHNVWYLFIHRVSLQLYAVSPTAYRRYVAVHGDYVVVSGLTQDEAWEDVNRSLPRLMN